MNVTSEDVTLIPLIPLIPDIFRLRSEGGSLLSIRRWHQAMPT